MKNRDGGSMESKLAGRLVRLRILTMVRLRIQSVVRLCLGFRRGTSHIKIALVLH